MVHQGRHAGRLAAIKRGLNSPGLRGGQTDVAYPQARAADGSNEAQILSYRYGDKRKNNPEVGMVDTASDGVEGETRWAYDPHIDPTLNFDPARAGIESLIDDALASGDEAHTVETKTWSKPAQDDARITFDGDRLLVAGRELERDPAAQARAQAAWLRNLLPESTGRNFEVFPVVVFPGWFVEQADGSLRNMWVLESKALPKFWAAAPQRLAPDQVNLASFHLSRFIRTNERDRTRR